MLLDDISQYLELCKASDMGEEIPQQCIVFLQQCLKQHLEMRNLP
jgi:hypothetical protein